MKFLRRRHAAAGLALALAAGAIAASAAPAARPPELPLEQLTMEKLPPADGLRLYLSDPTMPHLVDGRVHVIDGGAMRYLGMLGTGFAGSTTLSRDRKQIFVATTYYSRLQRGTRADVLEVYGSDDLAFQYEIELPARHIQSLPTKPLLGTSEDGRFLFVQNATPATSITVVDLPARKVAGEIAAPGCYGAYPWPGQPRRLSTVCGDGTLATFELDEQGALKSQNVSAPFFDPDQDPVFTHYQLSGTRLSFVSYGGQVYEVDLVGDKPEPHQPWPLLSAAERKKGWRPGGYELFALDPRSGRLFVAMHDKASEGSHKNPASEIWVFDVNTQRRIGRMPGEMALSMALAQGDKPRLFLLSAMENRLVSFDVSGAKLPTRPLARSAPMGETPIYLEMH